MFATNMTIGVGVKFKMQNQSPFDLISSRDANYNLQLKIYCQMGPSAKGVKIPEVSDWWDTIKELKHIDISSWTARKDAKLHFKMSSPLIIGEEEITASLDKLARFVVFMSNCPLGTPECLKGFSYYFEHGERDQGLLGSCRKRERPKEY